MYRGEARRKSLGNSQAKCFPSCIRGFDSLRPLQSSSQNSRQRARREAIVAVRAARVGEPPHRMAGRVAALEHHVGRQLMRIVAGMNGDRSILVDLVVAEERMAVALVAAPLALLVVLVLEPCLYFRGRLAEFRLPSRQRRSAEHGGEGNRNCKLYTSPHRTNPVIIDFSILQDGGDIA